MTYRICPACGSLVGDTQVHATWHGDLPQGQKDRLLHGHPRDWPRTPGAPTPPTPPTPDPPVEPARSVREVVLDPGGPTDESDPTNGE